MKIKGFTISEISIGMILGSFIVIFSFFYLVFLNQHLVLQLNTFEKLNEIKLFQKIISTEFQKNQPKIGPENIIFFVNPSTKKTLSSLHIYSDSIVFQSLSTHVFHLKSQIEYMVTDSSQITMLEFQFPSLPQSPQLRFQKQINPGFLLKSN